MTIAKVFKSTALSSVYVMKGGKPLYFVGGELITDQPDEIAELEAEVAARHPFIYIDENKKEVDMDNMDPLEQIKQKAIAEYLAAQLAAETLDAGTSTQELTPTNSSDLTDTTASSDSGISASLTALKSK